jgi:hypothetical protein
MNTINKLYQKWIISFLAVLFIYSAAHAQNKDQSIPNLIQAKQYVFKVQTMLPLGGRSRQVTSDYDLTVSGDTVISYLPYIGRAYAGIDPNDNGMNFTSTSFDYKLEPRKKGGWDITISPKDTKDVRIMTLSLSENGYGSLQVISNNRSNISYNGYITAIRQKK